MSACRCDCCAPAVVDAPDCTCPGMWMSILPPPWCPVHGQVDGYRVTC